MTTDELDVESPESVVSYTYIPSAQPFECEWCADDATTSVVWECEHASAICDQCFGPPDPWGIHPEIGLDILDFDGYGGPINCPSCTG